MRVEKSDKLRELERHFPAGATLFQQGDESREMYILLNGEAEVLVDNVRVAVVAGTGSYLGEMSTLLTQPRTTTVRATKDSRFIVVGPGQVRAFFGYSTELALKLATMLARRLKDTTQDLSEARRALEQREAEHREVLAKRRKRGKKKDETAEK